MPSIFTVPNRFEAAYRRSLVLLVNREIPTDLNYDNIDDWLERLASVSQDENFIAEAERVTVSMVRDINIHNVRSWRQAAQQSYSGSKYIRRVSETEQGSLGESVRTSVAITKGLVSSLPQRVSDSLKQLVGRLRNQGNTEKGIHNVLRRKFIPLLSNRIKLLARTDPQRTNSMLTEGRSNDVGLQCFIWETAEDELVRPSHSKMNGVICFWSELPSPELLIGRVAILGYYAPGDCPNCRCSGRPVFSIDDLFDEHVTQRKVYFNRSIKLLTRAQFVELFLKE